MNPKHGPYRVNISGPSTSLTSDTYDGVAPFLAVPVPLFVVSGLDPRNEHTITMEKAGATYLDLDYVETYKVGGAGPPGGELNHQSNNNKAALIGKIVGPILGKHLLVTYSRPANFLPGFMLLAAVVFFFRRRRTKVPESWVNGVEKPERKLFGRKSNNSVQQMQDPRPESPSLNSPHTEIPGTYIPTPYTVTRSTNAPSTTGSTPHPPAERPVSVALLSPVLARRSNKLEEIRRLTVIDGGMGLSSGSGSEPHEVPLPLSPDGATAQPAGEVADSLMVPVVTDTTASLRHPQPHDSHPVGLPDEPPPQYDTVV